MKILRVITRMNLGGPSRQLLLLHKHLGLLDSEHVLAIGKVSDFEEESDVSFSKNLVRINSLRRGINPVLDFITVVELVKIIRREKPDIIHTHLSKAWILALFARKLASSRSVLIHTFHGHTLHGYFHENSAKFFLGIQKRASKKTDHLITVGDKISTELVQSGIGSPEKISVIYPGVFSHHEIVANVAQSFKIRLLFVGRLEPIKQPLLLLDICRELEALSCAYQLDVVGEGSMLNQMQTMAKNNDLNIIFHGWQQKIGRCRSSRIQTADERGKIVSQFSFRKILNTIK